MTGDTPSTRLPPKGRAIRLTGAAVIRWGRPGAHGGPPVTARRIPLPWGSGLHLALRPGPGPLRLRVALEPEDGPQALAPQLLLRLDGTWPRHLLRAGWERPGAPLPSWWLPLETGVWQEAAIPPLRLAAGARAEFLLDLPRGADLTLAALTVTRVAAPDPLPDPAPPFAPPRPVPDPAARLAAPTVGAAALTFADGCLSGRVQTGAAALDWRAPATGRTGRIRVRPEGRVAAQIAPDLPPGTGLEILSEDGAPVWAGAARDAPPLEIRGARRADFRALVTGHAALPGARIELLCGSRVLAAARAAAPPDRTDLPGDARAFRLAGVLRPGEEAAPLALRLPDLPGAPVLPVLPHAASTRPPALPGTPPAGPVRGAVTRAEADRIEGHARHPEAPDAPVTLHLLREGRVLARARTGGHPRAAAPGDTGFRFDLPPGLAARGAVLEVAAPGHPGAIEGGRIDLPAPPGLTGPAPAPGAARPALRRGRPEGAGTPTLALLTPGGAVPPGADALPERMGAHLRVLPSDPPPDLSGVDVAVCTDPGLDARALAGAAPWLALAGWARDGDWSAAPLALACDHLLAAPGGAPALAAATGRPVAPVADARALAGALRAPPPLRIGIKCAARTAARAEWGDAFFADALAAALRRLGHVARVDDRGAWTGGIAESDDAAIVLRGLIPHPGPRPHQVNLLWLISHPDAVSPAEIAAYDHAFVASAPHAGILDRLVPGRVSFLPQCTDPGRFAFDADRAAAPPGPPLYVANSRKVFRDPVRWALAHDLPLEVHGMGWEALSDDPRLRDRLVPNEVLGELYGAAALVVCDHWADMARLGYVSNRVFDVLAAGGRLLVDEVAGLDALVPARFLERYASEAAFVAALDAPVPRDPALRREAADWAAAHHSFDARAAVIAARIAAALEGRARSGSAPAASDLPSPPLLS